MNLSDFKRGDILVITSRSSRGEERRVAEVFDINYRGNGLVTYMGVYDSKFHDLQPTGQGAFDPTQIGAKPFGFHVKVEIVGYRTPWKPWTPKPRDPGYDPVH